MKPYLKYIPLWIAFLAMLYVANFTEAGAFMEWLGPHGLTKLLW